MDNIFANSILEKLSCQMQGTYKGKENIIQQSFRAVI